MNESEYMTEYNIYCDESCYLENDHKDYMLMGAIKCEKTTRKKICNDLRNIKQKHNIRRFQEIKWTKISNSNVNLYKELINYFFDNNLNFRAIIVDKSTLNHKKFNQTHDTFYYKVYYQLLAGIIMTNSINYIYLDIKDTKSARKIRTLQNCLINGKFDFNANCVKNIQSINSKESELIQLCDVLIGAIGFLNRKEHLKNNYNKAKKEIVDLIIEKSNYSLRTSTFISEDKFNLFFMRLQK